MMIHTKREQYFEAILFGLPMLGLAMLVAPLLILGGVYAKYYGLSLSDIAFIILVSRIFDGVTDPIMGYWSDKIRQRTGSRKPMIGIGAILCALSSWFLFVPPEGSETISWFCIWFFSFYLGTTAFLISYMAWASEVSSKTEQRSFLYSGVFAFMQSGSFLFYLIPLLPLFNTEDLTPEVLRVTTSVGIILMLISLIPTLRYLPSGTKSASLPPGQVKRGKFQAVYTYARDLISNKPFLIFLSASFCSGLAMGMWMGLIFIYVDSYMGLGNKFAQISLVGMGVGFVALFVGRKIMLKVGGRTSWLGCLLVTMFGFIGTGLLTSGSNYFLMILTAYTFIIASSSVIQVVTMTLLSAISDYGKLINRQESTGGYYSVLTFVNKLQVALGSALGLTIAGWFGFDASGDSLNQSSQGVIGLKLAVAVLPVLLTAFAMYVVSKFPLNGKRIEAIRRALMRRNAKVNITG